MRLIYHACEEHHDDDYGGDAISYLGNDSLLEHKCGQLHQSDSHVDVGETHREGRGGSESAEG